MRIIAVLICLTACPVVSIALADTGQQDRNLSWEYSELDAAEHGADVVWPQERTPTPAVQVIYAVPTDREERDDYAAAVRHAILHVQDWYAQQLKGLTFAIDVPIPLVCHVEQPAAYYEGKHGWDRVAESVQHCAPVQHWSDEYVWVIYIDAEFDCDGGGELGRAGRGLTIIHGGDLQGLLYPDNYQLCPTFPPRGAHGWIGGLAHELGHVFELRHPPGCDPLVRTPECDYHALMWFGFYWDYPETYLTLEDKDILSGSPWFRLLGPR